MKRLRDPLLALLCCASLGVAAWQLWTHPVPAQYELQLGDGSRVSVLGPPSSPHLAVVAVPANEPPANPALMALAQRLNVRLAVLPVSGDCHVQLTRLQQLEQRLGSPVPLVGGYGDGANLAWRWLASQHDAQAQALSVGFSLPQDNCAHPQQVDGRWQVVWNDNPDDDTARFLRAQHNVDTQIANYDTPLPALLIEHLGALLSGKGSNLPLIEVPAEHPGDTMVLFYSGDGGWRDLDRDVAAQLALRGYPVVGIDCLRYFWQHKSPEQGATDLAKLMQRYREERGVRQFVLIGFSFGADALPAIYNRLPADAQAQVRSLVLLALARSADFEIKVNGWFGQHGSEVATGPELEQLPAAKVLCLYGKEEAVESGCTLPSTPGTHLELPGGHHYDGDYPKLAERIIQLIESTPPVP